MAGHEWKGRTVPAPRAMNGGCLCGAVRYRTDGPALQTTLCHCEDCRKASGAPVVAWTFFRGDHPEWTRGEPRFLAWAGRERWFCPECGTPLAFRDPGIPGLYEVTTCSLDQPEEAPPCDHNWVCDRVPWFDTADTLPRHPENSPPCL